MNVAALQELPLLSHGTLASMHMSEYFISLGCGLQNGMCTTFSGAVIRTTHVTGTLTDIGIIVGHAIFHQRTRKNLWKLKILCPLYTAFCFGGLIGWYAFRLLKNKAMLLACALVATLGVAHLCYFKILRLFQKRQRQRKPVATDEPIGLTVPTADICGEPADGCSEQLIVTEKDSSKTI